MPYRAKVPEGAEPIDHFMYHLGTRFLVEARQQLYGTTYDAPLTTLTAREREMMRMPIAKGIECQTCLAMRFWRDLPGFSDEIPEPFYQNAIAVNLDWEGFSERERLLVEFSHRFENDHKNINSDDDFWERIYAHFTEADVGDILIILSTWSSASHVIRTLGVGGATGTCEIANPEQLQRLARAGHADPQTSVAGRRARAS